MTHPMQLVLALAAAMLAGAFGGFFLRGWTDRRQRNRQERAREALLSSRTTRPDRLAPAEPRLAQSSFSTWSHSPRRAPSLPSDVPGIAAVAPIATRLPGAANGATVLVVDDRYELRAVNAAYLAGHGYRVIEAQDGDAALEAVRRERPDAILLDHSMPNRTGLEVVSELKADPATAGIPIVFMTAHSYGAVGRKAMEAGCASFLPKPVDPVRVLQEIARHTGTRAADGAWD